MAETPKIDYTNRDYESIRADYLKRITRMFPEWTDLSESDFGVFLLELDAMGHDILSYYLDRTANEAYMPTATQRQSVLDICKQLGYQPKEPNPSTVELVFEVIPGTSSVTIPAGFKVSTEVTANESPIVFETISDLIIPAGNTGLEQDNGEYLYKVRATQGITIPSELLGSSTGQPAQVFKVKYPDVIEGSLELYVDEGAGFSLWTDVTRLLVQATTDGKHYWRDIDADGYTWIVFGSGEDGKIPVEGTNNIRAKYRVGGGIKTNVGANKIVKLVSNLSGVKRVFNPSAAVGGLDRESIEEIKRNAPRFLRTNMRAVTASDYKALALTNQRVLRAHAEQDADTYNLVHVYVIVPDGVDSEPIKQEVLMLLDDLKPITTQVQVDDGEFVEADLELSVLIDMGYSQATMRDTITEVLQNAFAILNRDFGESEQIYKMYSRIGSLAGVLNITIDKMTSVPRVKNGIVTGNATWSDITVNPGNNLNGYWKVKMTSATDFAVYYSATGAFEGEEVAKGNGTLGSNFTSSGGEITFKITAGGVPMATNDYWTFKTHKYVDSLIIEPKEFLKLGSLVLNITGGAS